MRIFDRFRKLKSRENPKEEEEEESRLSILKGGPLPPKELAKKIEERVKLDDFPNINGVKKNQCFENEYFEVKVPEGDGRCSDDACPCSEVRIPRGSGYCYISQEVVNCRHDARSLKALEKKLEHIARRMDGFTIFGSGVANPILICEQGAKLRGIDLEIAAADAKYLWETGKAPLRPTPLAGSKEAKEEKKRQRTTTGNPQKPISSRIDRPFSSEDYPDSSLTKQISLVRSIDSLQDYPSSKTMFVSGLAEGKTVAISLAIRLDLLSDAGGVKGNDIYITFENSNLKDMRKYIGDLKDNIIVVGIAFDHAEVNMKNPKGKKIILTTVEYLKQLCQEKSPLLNNIGRIYIDEMRGVLTATNFISIIDKPEYIFSVYDDLSLKNKKMLEEIADVHKTIEKRIEDIYKNDPSIIKKVKDAKDGLIRESFKLNDDVANRIYNKLVSEGVIKMDFGFFKEIVDASATAIRFQRGEDYNIVFFKPDIGIMRGVVYERDEYIFANRNLFAALICKEGLEGEIFYRNMTEALYFQERRVKSTGVIEELRILWDKNPKSITIAISDIAEGKTRALELGFDVVDMEKMTSYHA